MNFVIAGSLHDECPVHVASNHQPSAVAHGIAPSNEDLDEVASISSCADLNSQCVFPNFALPRMDLCLEFQSTTTVHLISNFLQQILITGLQTWTDPSQPSDQFWHPSRSSSRIVHPSRRSGPILHPSRPSRSLVQILPSRALRHVKFSSSPQYHSNTSPMQRLFRPSISENASNADLCTSSST